jgi:hypothetical protein
MTRVGLTTLRAELLPPVVRAATVPGQSPRWTLIAAQRAV